jgi:hypothetical protein
MLQVTRSARLYLKTFPFGVLKIIFCLLVLCSCVDVGIINAQTNKPLYRDQHGHLKYSASDRGDRIPDFSFCGYAASEKPIPAVPAKVVVPLQEGDATKAIQSAIDYVSQLPLSDSGFRGAVQLERGKYRLKGRLKISASGVVLRGKGMGDNGTIIVADGKERRTLLTIQGRNDINREQPVEVADNYVPVNATSLRVTDIDKFSVGQSIFIHRASTQAWIDTLGMRECGGEDSGYLGWKPGQRDIRWDRTITGIKDDTLFFEVPITTALDKTFGDSFVTAYQWKGRINNVGAENLNLKSAYNTSNPQDEDHCFSAITVENAENVWVRQIIFSHFAGSAVAVYETGRKVVVQDCKSLAPMSEIAGWRRNTFFTMGQQILFQRLYSEEGYHDFAVGFCAAGPNAFVECQAYLPYSYSGAIDSWASGTLFDIVKIDGNELSFANKYVKNHGAGWTAANSVFWQCSAAKFENFAPPTAMNWAFGIWGRFIGNGFWGEQNSYIKPRSLYYAQLAERLNVPLSDYEDQYMPDPGEATSSPKVEEAEHLSKFSFEPPVLLKDWIMEAVERDPIGTSEDGAQLLSKVCKKVTGKKSKETKEKEGNIEVRNGWIVKDGKILTGMLRPVPWWRGDPRPYEIPKSQPAITRFVPGRYGWGYTDNLEDVIEWMKETHTVGLEHNYGLWYDRRRDDHLRVRRMDGNVWAPFYQQPFARSGQGTAWDGLSKYDLTKYDNFYWSRLKKFADLADEAGNLLIHKNYFQHNILEAGAHWADSPWRPANNINDTDFPEPPPYAGDKRIFFAEQFYDINHPVRRKLHEAYIRKCLDNFVNNHSVLQEISAEYTGPLHFTQFWLDVIGKWQEETGNDAFIGLSTTKDVQDAILAKKENLQLIDVIDIKYWSYKKDGGIYAPEGGKNLAPRQFARIMKTGSRSFGSVYRSVREYKDKYPEKAVIYSEGRFDVYSWAVLMAGGSLPVLPADVPDEFLRNVATMLPYGKPHDPSHQSVLRSDDGNCIVYASGEAEFKVDLQKQRGKFQVRYIDPKSGKVVHAGEILKSGKEYSLQNIFKDTRVIWISKL